VSEDIVKLLSRPGSGSSIILVLFLIPSAGTQFQGKPLQSGRKIHERFAIYGCKSPFISETVRDRLSVAMER